MFGRSAASQDAAAQGLAERVTGAWRCKTSARAPTGMLSAASISVRPLTGMLPALSTPLEPTSVRAATTGAGSFALPANRDELQSEILASQRIARQRRRPVAGRAGSQRLHAIGAVTADRIGRGLVGRRRRRRRRPGAGLRGFRGNALDPHVGQPGLPEAERYGGRSRNVDDPSADERPPIGDPDDQGPAVVEIEDPDPRSHRQAAMRRGHSLSAIERRQAHFRRRGVAAYAESDRAENQTCSHPQLASRASRPLGVRRNGNTKLTNLPAARASGLGAPEKSRDCRGRNTPLSRVATPWRPWLSRLRASAGASPQSTVIRIKFGGARRPNCRRSPSPLVGEGWDGGRSRPGD